MQTKHAGFTLIELLVVIAIIGILSSVVLASLNAARGRSGDSAIQATIVQVRSQSEIFYDNGQNYGNVANNGSGAPIPCDTAIAVAGSLFADPVISAQIRNAKETSGRPWSEVLCVSNPNSGKATSWALTVPFKSAPTTRFWCIDNIGSSKEESANLTGSSCN